MISIYDNYSNGYALASDVAILNRRCEAATGHRLRSRGNAKSLCFSHLWHRESGAMKRPPHYLIKSAAAFAATLSCAPTPPLVPIAPISLPFSISGNAPMAIAKPNVVR
jgi:hypothetical protein